MVVQQPYSSEHPETSDSLNPTWRFMGSYMGSFKGPFKGSIGIL